MAEPDDTDKWLDYFGAKPRQGEADSDDTAWLNYFRKNQASNAAAADNSALRLPKMAGHAIGGAALNILGMPGDLWQAGNSLFPPGSGANLSIPSRGAAPFFATTGEMSNALNLGLPQHPELTPKGWEKPAVAGLEGAVGAAPMLLTGGAAAPILASGALGGIAAQVTHEAHPDSTALPILAGMGVGLGVQGVSSMLAGNTVERIASGLGNSRTIQEAGTAAQDLARQWKTTVMPAKQLIVSAPLDAAIASAEAAAPGSSAVKLSNYTSILKSINNRAGDLQASADVLTPGGAKRLANALDIRDKLNTLAGVGPDAPTSWQNARALRSIIGDAMSDPMLVKDIGQTNMEALYKGLTQDLSTTAKSVGAEDLWKNYNSESTRLYNFAANKLSKVISTDDPRLESMKPESVAASLLSQGKKGATDLSALRAEIPGLADELAAATLRHPTAWAGLSDEAKGVLIENPKLRKTLNIELPKRVPGLGTGNNLLTSVLSSEVGQRIGSMAMGTLGDHAGQVGTAIGLVAPLLYHGGKAIVKNPLMLAGPGAGALAGGTVNQLTSP